MCNARRRRWPSLTITWGRDRGFSLLEVLIAGSVLTIVVGALALLLGAATRDKMIVVNRAADTETARQTLEWMSERLRNAGLNIKPDDQPELRCQDMIVAQDASLRPQTNSVYVSGEILNTNTTAGDEVITIGFRESGGSVIQDIGSCVGAWSPASASVSDPRVAVTGLSFRYFKRNGEEVPAPTTDVDAIRDIVMIEITLRVQAVEGAFSPSQAAAQIPEQTFSRMVMLRNPRPDINLWLSPNETVEGP